MTGEMSARRARQLAPPDLWIVTRPYDFVKTLSPEGCGGRRRDTTAPVAVTSRAGGGTRGAAATLRSVAAPHHRFRAQRGDR